MFGQLGIQAKARGCQILALASRPRPEAVWKPRPESGLDCLTCAIFSRHEVCRMRTKASSGRSFFGHRSDPTTYLHTIVGSACPDFERRGLTRR